MEGRLLLDVVVRKSAAILELLASKDQSLLIWRNSLLILDLGLDLFSSISKPSPRNPALLSQLTNLPPIGAETPSVEQIPAGKNEKTYIVNGVRGLHLEGDGLTRKGLYENLHFGGCQRRKQNPPPEKKFCCSHCLRFFVVNVTLQKAWRVDGVCSPVPQQQYCAPTPSSPQQLSTTTEHD